MSEIEIIRLGHQGDGLAADGSAHPLTLPGEVIAPDQPPKILRPSPERVAPPCRHFPGCGGCALQHASDTFLAGWKEDVVRRALEARGLAAPFRPIAVSPAHSRRRAGVTVRRTKKGVQWGFHAPASDQVVPIDGCLLLPPEMLALGPFFDALARLGASRKGALKVQVTASLTGWDVAVEGGKDLDAPARAQAARLLAPQGVARLAWAGEVIAQREAPLVAMGRARVPLPPGAFLQATEEGAAALLAGVRDALGEARSIADLFSGCGTFALPLAERAEVLAIEADAAMLGALDAGWRTAKGLHGVRTEVRDLFRRPLMAEELRGFDGVVIDPPRAGAEAQATQLAASPVPRIAAVSCNPVTFARDAQILVAGGYALDWVQVIDQFRWSSHVELVAGFSRTDAPRAR